MRSDTILPKLYFDKNYEVYIPTKGDWNGSRVDLNDEVVCFTDGRGFRTKKHWPGWCWCL